MKLNPVEKMFPTLAHAKNMLILMDSLDSDAKLFGGDQLRRVRDHYGISQTVMADHLGITNFHLCKIEKGHQTCTGEMLSKMYWVACLLERYRDAEKQEGAGGVSVAEPGGRVGSGSEG